MRKEAFDLTTDSVEGEVIGVAVSHNKTRKAYFLHFQPLKRSESHGMKVTECDPMKGMRGEIEKTGRFSEKKLNELAANVEGLEIYQPMLEAVLSQNKVKVTGKEKR